MRNGGEHDPARLSAAGATPAQELEKPLVALGDFLFAHTGGQPFYLLETLKMFRDLELLVPWLAADGTWRLDLDVEMATAVAQERSRRELLPPSVRTMIQARLAPLSRAARQLVQVSAVLATAASAQRLWQVAGLRVQAGDEALEEAVGSGILLEEEEEAGHPGGYRFAHDLIREVVYTELGEARRLVLHQRALALRQAEGARASELAYHALAAGQTEAAYRYSMQAGDEAMAVLTVEDAIGHYEQARSLLHAHQRLQTVLGASEVDHLYVHLGRAYSLHNAWQQAKEAYEELLAYAQQHQLPTLVSMTLNHLAILAAQQSFDQAQVHTLLEQAWQMAQTSHEQRVLAETR